MQIYLKNFGILREADIEMPGLTVIVGENGTGRHTLCRAVFTLTDLLGGRTAQRRGRREGREYVDQHYVKLLKT